MIPTTVSSSPAAAATSICGSGSPGSGFNTTTTTSSNNNNSNQIGQQNSTVMIGLASLILEGRAVSDESFQPPQMTRTGTIIDGSIPGATISGSGNGSSSVFNQNNSSCNASFGLGGNGNSSGSVSIFNAGRQSPTCRPSTSRAAASSGGHVINITTNPCAFPSVGVACSSRAMDASPLFIDPYPASSSGSSSAESIHQRWTQKLCQLRQVSPAASLSSKYEQPVAVEAREPEIVALAINESNTTDCGEFEIVRRSLLNRQNLANTVTGSGGSACAGSASSSPGSGSENFLFSLQSLATTRLRSGSPAIESGAAGNSNSSYRYSGLPSSPLPSSMYIYRNTTPTTHRFVDPPCSGSSSGSGIQSPRPNWPPSCAAATATNITNPMHSKVKFMRQTAAISSAAAMALGRPCAPNVGAHCPYSATMAIATTAMPSAGQVPTALASSSTYPQQGPHCDQFLRKMGLVKVEGAEPEDHICDMSYVNITCSRWRAYCHKMETIMERGQPVCIEVYLGPVNQKILLEQWIITQKEKVPPPTITLSSLCGAIRSQLYFSQISAWCDLIQNSDKTIYDTGRIIFPTPTGAAGDLATPTAASAAAAAVAVAAAAAASASVAAAGSKGTPSTSPTTAALSQLSNIMVNQRPRLNIFYRIKSFDSTACFNSKPNVHNFPNVNISENFSVSVCLKSLPRMSGGIPKVGNLSISTTLVTPSTATATTITTTVTSHISAGVTTTMIAKSTNGVSSNGAMSRCFTGNSNSSNGNGTNSHKLREAPQMTASASALTSVNTINCDIRKTISPSSKGNAVAGSKSPASTTSDSSDGSINAVSLNGSNNSSISNSQASGSKHKCMFFIDEEELQDGADECNIADEDDNPSDTATSTCDSTTSASAFSSSANMSHREKQLLKYRKRMLKRDKKHQNQRKPLSTTSDTAGEMGAAMEIQRHHDERKEQNSSYDRHNCQPMEEGDDESCTSEAARSYGSPQIEMISTGTQTPMTCCQRCGREKTLICLKCSRDGVCETPFSPQPQMIIPTDSTEMDDSASSISSSEIIQTPRNKAELLLQAIQRTPKVAKYKKLLRESNGSGSISICSSVTNPSPRSIKHQNNNHLSDVSTTNGALNGDSAVPGSGNDVPMNGNSNCQVCKRQKTQHNFDTGNEFPEDEELLASNFENGDDKKMTEVFQKNSTVEQKIIFTSGKGEEEQQMETQAVTSMHPKTATLPIRSEVMEEESFESSTKLKPRIDRCTIPNCTTYQATNNERAGGDASYENSKSNRNSTPPNITLMDNKIYCETQFKTPTSDCSNSFGQQQKNLQMQSSPQPSFQHKQTPKPNLLQISGTYHTGNGYDVGAAGDGFMCIADVPAQITTESSHLQKPTLSLRKAMPKVNLTPIFCNPIPAATITSSYSSPIPIHGATPDATFAFDSGSIDSSNNLLMHSSHVNININTNTNANINANTTDNNIPVQKSYSAPTLPNSPSLSPRFAKQAAIYKRRSRHLSDRSDRSSLGSDEQFSDEDLESGSIYSPTASPLKQVSRVAGIFGRQPLLGNLEESLLQKRLTPKTEVSGFKVLLGASGGFCPTQLTIAASAYFFELHGETLSTPYLCDVRLPRKGYSVPRAGTVQVTLLNPMGTVVRMFVIPYDMRDMPPLHQTFIRQRILAEASTNEATEETSLLSINHQNNCKDDATRHNNVCNNGTANLPNRNNNDNILNNHQDGRGNRNTANSNNKYRLSPSGGLYGESNLGHFISAEHMKRLRYSIHLRFQTSRSGRLSLHTDIRLLISRRTDCDTAAAHAKGVLEAPNDLVTDTVMPANPKYSARQESNNNNISKI